MIKHPLDEILAQRQVVEPPFLLQRQQRKTLHDGARKDAGARPAGVAVLIVYFPAE